MNVIKMGGYLQGALYWRAKLRTKEQRRLGRGNLSGAYFIKSLSKATGTPLSEVKRIGTYQILSYFSGLIRTMDALVDEVGIKPQDAAANPNYIFYRNKFIAAIDKSPLDIRKKNAIKRIFSRDEKLMINALADAHNHGLPIAESIAHKERTAGQCFRTTTKIFLAAHGNKKGGNGGLINAMENLFMAAQMADDLHDLHEDHNVRLNMVNPILAKFKPELERVEASQSRAKSMRWLRRNAPRTVASAEMHMRNYLAAANRHHPEITGLIAPGFDFFLRHRRVFDAISNVDSTHKRMRIDRTELQEH
ncbi:MAG: hypothetical protein ABH863_03500 [Candidatus Micrarchaeota archaeon]